MKGKVFWGSLFALLVPTSALACVQEEQCGAGLASIVNEGTAYVSGRYRFEWVDQEGLDKDAKASTLRTRLGFTSGELAGFSGTLEVEDVSEIGANTFNNTVNGHTDYPIVADPDGTEINQSFITYKGINDTVIRGGREALKLDNVRFVGDVGWRQNNQTFDGVNVTNSLISDVKLFYGYVGNVNRIFGEDSDVGNWETNLNIFNVQYSGIEAATITAYAYLFDIEDSAQLSTTSFGTRINGSSEVSEELSLLYDAEYAYQQDYEDNPLDYSVSYWRTDAGVRVGNLDFIGGYESLGSDDGAAAFSTPFATLHAWNGWADKFLSTPADGLNDAYGKVHVKTDCGIAADVVYHYFSSEQTDQKFGDEWDFAVSKKINDNISLGVKYAMYESANFATDTEKLILTIDASFSQ